MTLGQKLHDVYKILEESISYPMIAIYNWLFGLFSASNGPTERKIVEFNNMCHKNKIQSKIIKFVVNKKHS